MTPAVLLKAGSASGGVAPLVICNTLSTQRTIVVGPERLMHSEAGLLASCFPPQLEDFLKKEMAFRVFAFQDYLILGFVSRSPHREPVSERSGFMVFWGVCLNRWSAKIAADKVVGLLEMVIHIFKSNGYAVADLDLAADVQRLITGSSVAPSQPDISLAGLAPQFDRAFLDFGHSRPCEWATAANIRKLLSRKNAAPIEFVWKRNMAPAEAIIFFVEAWRLSGMPKNVAICGIRPEVSGPVRLVLIPDGWAFGKTETLEIGKIILRVPNDDVSDAQ